MSLANVPVEYAHKILEASAAKLKESEQTELRVQLNRKVGDRVAALERLCRLHPTLEQELEDDWPYDNPVAVEAFRLSAFDGYTFEEFADEVQRSTSQRPIKNVPIIIDREPKLTAPVGWVRNLHWRADDTFDVDTIVKRPVYIGKGEFRQPVETRALFSAGLSRAPTGGWILDIYGSGDVVPHVLGGVARDLAGGAGVEPARVILSRETVEQLAEECDAVTELVGLHPDGECDVGYYSKPGPDGRLPSLPQAIVDEQSTGENEVYGYGLTRQHRFGWTEQVVWSASFKGTYPRVHFRKRTSRRGVKYVVDRLFGRT